jgi:hypothetical protein
VPLSDAQIKAVKPRSRQYTLTDADGLELLVTPAGAKVALPVPARRPALSVDARALPGAGGGCGSSEGG